MHCDAAHLATADECIRSKYIKSNQSNNTLLKVVKPQPTKQAVGKHVDRTVCFSLKENAYFDRSKLCGLSPLLLFMNFAATFSVSLVT